jgi:hypothetical protein
VEDSNAQRLIARQRHGIDTKKLANAAAECPENGLNPQIGCRFQMIALHPAAC